MAAVENEELDVDQLAEQVAKAMELITFCRSKLKHTEAAVQKAFEAER